MRFRFLLVVLLLLIAAPAAAHTTAEIEDWETEWVELYQAAPDSPLGETLVYELERARYWFELRHPCHYSECVLPVPSNSQGMGNHTSDVERWRPLVAKHFADVNRALCLIQWESGGNPNAYNPSGAAGLFQVMPMWFAHFGGSAFDPEDNTRVAALVLAEQGWTAWSVVKRGKC